MVYFKDYLNLFSTFLHSTILFQQHIYLVNIRPKIRATSLRLLSGIEPDVKGL